MDITEEGAASECKVTVATSADCGTISVVVFYGTSWVIDCYCVARRYGTAGEEGAILGDCSFDGGCCTGVWVLVVTVCKGRPTWSGCAGTCVVGITVTP